MDNLDREEAFLNEEESRLDPQSQLFVESKIANDGKQPVVAWLLWFFLGTFGAHRFYMQESNAVTMLVLTLIGYVLAIVLIGFIFLLATWIWWIVDAFSMMNWLKADRLRVKRQAINIVNSRR
ncbi:TM2 domain-containing protein [Apilactobacillus xinyiensis]|uniref:TM2 domain-containing protein n=1 Tax=Apilactobacillus xinyiensis TaxID=2841032 RepID=UPI001C7CB87D|nr:TM2 domain-containing protein [Apilactobacillus xinyiensis]